MRSLKLVRNLKIKKNYIGYFLVILRKFLQKGPGPDTDNDPKIFNSYRIRDGVTCLQLQWNVLNALYNTQFVDKGNWHILNKNEQECLEA